MRIGLVGCVKEKGEAPLPAMELYVSALFRGRRAYVERSCDRWYVLSAKHGLVRPSQVLAPYDEALTDASRTRRRVWSERVLRQLGDELGHIAGNTFEIHAGVPYRDFGLVEGLRAAGAAVDVPAVGLSQGRQLAFYASSAGLGRPAPIGVARGGVDVRGPLTVWLQQATSPVTLTFADIERILGRALPASARRHRAWWANSASQVVPRQWLAAGWHAASVDLVAEHIRLIR